MRAQLQRYKIAVCTLVRAICAGAMACHEMPPQVGKQGVTCWVLFFFRIGYGGVTSVLQRAALGPHFVTFVRTCANSAHQSAYRDFVSL